MKPRENNKTCALSTFRYWQNTKSKIGPRRRFPAQRRLDIYIRFKEIKAGLLPSSALYFFQFIGRSIERGVFNETRIIKPEICFHQLPSSK